MAVSLLNSKTTFVTVNHNPVVFGYYLNEIQKQLLLLLIYALLAFIYPFTIQKQLLLLLILQTASTCFSISSIQKQLLLLLIIFKISYPDSLEEFKTTLLLLI